MLRRLAPALTILLLGACSDSSDPPGECATDEDCAGAALCVDGTCDRGDAAGDAADAADGVDGEVSDDAGPDTEDDTAEDTAADAAPDGADDTAVDGADDAADGADDVADEEVTYPPLAFVTDPVDGDTFLPLDVVVDVRFNQAMNPLRFIASNITLQADHGEPLERLMTYDPETFTLSVSPPADGGDLRPVTPYTFRMADLIQAESGEEIGDTFRMNFSTTGYPGRGFLRELAEAYAPVIYQQVEEPSIDTFARIDYDGDFDPANNLDNAATANYGFVYYDVVESVSHFFVTYMLYYPGSHPNDRVTFEHDFVTVQLVLRKTEDRLGELRAFSTFYHETMHLWTIDTGWYDDGDAPSGGDEGIEGRLSVDLLEDDRHVSIFIESGRHSVCLPNESTTLPPCSPTSGDTAPFEDDTTGLVYRVAEAGQRIGDAPDDELTYSLRSFVEEFWALRNRIDGDDAVFGGEFEYQPPVLNEEEGLTRPGTGEFFPSALNADNAEGHWGELPFIFNTGDRTEQGTWFVDPAWAMNQLFSFPESFSPDYCFNPYLDIDVRTERRGCVFEE